MLFLCLLFYKLQMPDKVNRIKSRKLLFQELYSMKYNTLDHETFIETFYDNIFKFSKDEKYMNSMVKTITYYEKFYIYIINKYTPKYKIAFSVGPNSSISLSREGLIISSRIVIFFGIFKNKFEKNALEIFPSF